MIAPGNAGHLQAASPFSFEQSHRTMKPAHTLRQDLGRPSGGRTAGRNLSALYRSSSGARGNFPTGLRRFAYRGPQGARAGKRHSRSSTTMCRPPTVQNPIPIRRVRSRSLRWQRTPRISGSNISTSSTSDRASSTSSARNRVSPCPARRSCAATAILQRTAHSVPSPTASAPRKSSMCLATQTLIQEKSKNMRAVVDGKLPPGVTAKDIILAIIGEIGTAGGTGYALEYAGEAIRAISIEGAHDHLQHVGRRRCQGRLHCPRRESLHLSQGQAESAQGQILGRSHALLGDTALRTTARISTARSDSTQPNCRR